MRGYTPPSRLREFLSRLLYPSAWIMLHKYDKEWDHFVRMAIILNMVEVDPRFLHVTIAEKPVWVGNYPYAYAISTWIGDNMGVRPSFATIRLLSKFIAYKEQQNDTLQEEADI